MENVEMHQNNSAFDCNIDNNINDLNYYELPYQFFNFYYDVISSAYDFRNKSFSNRVRFTKVSRYVKIYGTFTMIGNVFLPFSDLILDFDKEHVRCAYSLRHSILDTLCISYHFCYALKCKPNLFAQLVSLDQVRITCFGGGPGTELVAISKTISDILDDKVKTTKHKVLQLYFTVIDACKEWEAWIEAVVKSVRSNLCNRANVNIHLRFVQSDLSNPLKKELVNLIRKSHILTMIKFLSKIPGKHGTANKKLLQLFKNIVSNMKPDSWIFFLDYAGGGYYTTVNESLRNFRNLKRLDNCLHVNHSLYLEKVQNNCYNKFTRQLILRKSSTKVSSGTWLKCMPNKTVVALEEVLIYKGKKKRKEKFSNLLQNASSLETLTQSLESLVQFIEPEIQLGLSDADLIAAKLNSAACEDKSISRQIISVISKKKKRKTKELCIKINGVLIRMKNNDGKYLLDDFGSYLVSIGKNQQMLSESEQSDSSINLDCDQYV